MAEKIKVSHYLQAGYFLYVFGVGLGIAGVCVYGGFNQWPFLDTIVVGGIAQFLFRYGKRRFRFFLSMETPPDSDDLGKVREMKEIDVLLVGYAIAVVYCAFWYGVGWAYL